MIGPNPVHALPHGRRRHLRRIQRLPQPLDVVFSFFADPRNLAVITPPWLHFEFLTPGDFGMSAGRILDHCIRLYGIRIRWQSEITCWDPPRRFVDEQRRGPYRLWIHEHTFRQIHGGTEVFDHVTYVVPGGELIHRIMVRRNLQKIFDFRSSKLRAIFGSDASAGERCQRPIPDPR